MITTLKNEALTVTVSSKGAEMQSLTANGIDYLWNGNPDYWTGRSPILFPVVGGLRNGRAMAAAGEVTVPKHGFVRQSELDLIEADDTHAVYRLCASDATRAVYPYEFALLVRFALEGELVRVTYEVENTGDTVMPFCIGGHPGFHVPLTDDDCFENYVLEFEKAETLDCPQVDLQQVLIEDRIRNRVLTENDRLPINHVMFRGDALIFDRLESRVIRLKSDKTGHGVEMDFHSFPFVAVWTPVEDSPFVCLEPWTGMCTCISEDDVFEHKIGMTELPAGQTATFCYTLRVF